MSNFFDIATPEEVQHHFSITTPEMLTRLRESFAHDTDRNYGYLASLYLLRGDATQSQHCLEQIKDAQQKMDFSISLHELVDA